MSEHDRLIETIARMVGIGERYADAFGLPSLNFVAQPRDLLTAEQSTEVADEDDDGGAVRPERAERLRFAGLGVLEGDGS